jgi:AraC-like DNA-binding protein
MFLDNYYSDLGIFLYLTPIISSLWAGFVLLANKNRIKPQVYLAIAFFMLAVGMLFSFLYDRYMAPKENMILRSVNMIFSVYNVITIWFYFVSLLHPSQLTKRFILKYIAIAMAYSILLLIPNFLGRSEDISGWKEVMQNLIHPVILFRLIAVIGIVTLEIYLLVKVMKMYRRHVRFIKEHYSYEENINLKWIVHILFLYLLLALFDLAWMVDSSFFTKAAFNVISIVVIVRIFWLGYRQDAIPTEDMTTNKNILAEDNPPDNDSNFTAQHNRLESQLVAYFEKEHPFLNSELNLNDVAKALNTNRTYLSQLFNQQLNTTFYLFVNKYRIKYAIKLIESDSTVTVDILADKSGFRSRSVFYKNFKEITGVAPSAYMKKE